MTNLQAPSSNARLPITPEQALVILPAAGGALIAVALSAFALVPFFTKIVQQDQRLHLYQQQEQDLPLLRRQQLTMLLKIEQASRQEERLLKLVSAVDKLDTLLTILNQMATSSGVAMLTVEPERKVSAADGEPAQSQPKSQDETRKPLVPDDERFAKQSYLMTVEGPYMGLLEFLRKVETLNTAILISDLEIQVGSSSGSAGGATGAAATGQIKPTMKFRLTAYKHIPPNSARTEGAPASSGG